MIDFAKELEDILDNDPLKLLAVKPKESSIVSADERLLASFEEINAFVREHNREPAAGRDISERKLYSRLKGLRNHPEKVVVLTEFDSFGLLGGLSVQEPTEVYSVDDVLVDDPLGLLDDAGGETDPDDIFTLVNVPKATAMPDHVARRKQCKEFARKESQDLYLLSPLNE